MFMGTAAQSPEPKTSPKRVSFALDTNLSQQDIPTPSTDSLDGAIGNLELYRSGAVKMRFDNGIVLDVCYLHNRSRLHMLNRTTHR